LNIVTAIHAASFAAGPDACIRSMFRHRAITGSYEATTLRQATKN